MASSSALRKSTASPVRPVRWPDLPPAEPFRRPQEELFVSLLLRTSIRLQTAFDRRFLPFGVTAQEAAVLVRCADSGGLSAGDLARAMGRDKSKITRFVDRLEKRRLLVRATHPRDHRLLIIATTPRGRRLIPQLTRCFEDIRKRFLSGIPNADLASLQAILARLEDNLGSLREPRHVRP